MHRFSVFVIILTVLSLFPVTGFSKPFYLGGIQVNEPDHEKWVLALKHEKMNTIAVTVYSYQGDWDSDQLSYKKENPGLINEIRAAKKHGLHVVLILRTALDHAYPKNKFLWHGLIMPKTEALLESWFEKYTEFVLYWAKIAQEEGVDILGVASEMNSLTSTLSVDAIPKLQDWYLDRLKQQKLKGRLLEHDAEIKERHLWVRGHENYASYETFLDDKQLALESWARQTAFFDDDNPVARINEQRKKLESLWKGLVGKVRKVFPRQLTYAANFDQYYKVGFWDALDVMGINAYFPLRHDLLGEDEEHLLEEKLIQGWKSVFAEIDAFYEKQHLPNMPILFSELGYTRRKNCTIEPWADTGFSLIGLKPDETFIVWRDQPVYYPERALAIEALHRVSKDRTKHPLIGILYWKLSTIPSHLDIEQFVTILGNNSRDPILRSLQKFAR